METITTRRGGGGGGMQKQKWRPSVRFPSLLILLSLICFFSVVVAVDVRSDGYPVFPQQEAEALRKIGIKLKNDEKQWNDTVRNCNSSDGQNSGNNSTRLPLNKVICDCSFENQTICHVTNILLTRQNLTGVLPDEMANLTYLRYLDLSRNYLNGPIPAVWGSLPVFNLSLHGNRISGEIPKEIGSMPMIRSLQFENNELHGILPVEIGNLLSLERLFISANYITGALPSSFARLTNMTDFRIDGNNISGIIPDFIKNWRRVNRIDMVGTSMTGPIPERIDLLKNLTELRVSDIDGPDMGFPALQNAEHLTELVLRNCSISGEIPIYMGTMKYLKVLDLSFNRLSGQVPPKFEGLAALEYLYLTSNGFTGEIPPWMLRNKQSNKINIDISYNNFTGSPPPDCQEGNVNMVASFSSSRDNSVAPCFRKDFPCSTKPHYTSFFINCGGQKTVINGIEYDEDSSQLGTSAVHVDKSGRWAYSSTGDFTGNEDANFIATNTSILNVTYFELYRDARLTPVSLKYYGLCLKNGYYSVQLHFAEIVFTNDQTYWSLGKRIFDVLIQGRKVLKDFNIKESAGGSGRSVIMNFTTLVTDNTLEIHLYWAGKGTTALPERGNYGPLISAISVTQSSGRGAKNVSTVAAVLSAIAAFLVLCTILIVLLWRKGCFKRSKRALNQHNLQTQPNYYFNTKDINAATRNFDPANKIGEGGFGPVYKGVLADGTQIAVKQLSPSSKQGSREFLNEIGMVSALQHPNLVKLFGCSIEGDQLLLIYEYMENNSLGRALFGRLENRLKMDWGKKFTICLGIAKGLTFLHEESSLRIVHRDIKPDNILLDKDLNPKISDFGLAKLDEKDKSHISTRIAGTAGYMAPEYATRGYLTEKADVYSFGIVSLEVVSGKSNTKFIPTEEFFYLVDWALILFEEGRILELVDPGLGSNYSQEEVSRVLHVSLLCTNPSPTQRPTMSTVVRMLVGEMPIPPVKHRTGNEEWKRSAVHGLSHSEEKQTHPSAESSGNFYGDDEDVISQEISC